MPSFFIDRPRFAWVVALFIILAGLLALPNLPVAQYPNVAPTNISISAFYPGASASTVNESVASLIEEEINGVRGLLYYETTSDNFGGAEINVTFRPGVDAALAQVDVQNRIKRVESRLPPAVMQQGIQVEEVSSNFLLFFALSSSDANADTTAIADYAARNINNELRRVPGVGRVRMFSAERAMRIWVDPVKLVGYGLTMEDVQRAIAAQNVQVPAGQLGDEPARLGQQLAATIVVKGQMTSPETFGSLVLRANEDGSAVRIDDVARVELGRRDYQFEARLNGQPTVAVAVQLAAGANAMATATRVKAKLAELSTAFPAGVRYDVPYDTSSFVKVAISKVVMTLLEAVVLVFLVMYLFLQNIRYTLIPTIVVPICLLGTLAMMLPLGFSVNMLTMFGMVLAIGILVDDAIIVVENVERLMHEEGLSPKDATRRAMKQISGAIVGVTLVLTAVFLPLAFMSGSVGVIFRQFALSLAVSILFSGFLALTLTPALCATLLKPLDASKPLSPTGFFARFNRGFSRVTVAYEARTARLLQRSGRMMLIYLALVGVLIVLFMRLPTTFLPVEDQGYMVTSIETPPGATRGRTFAQVQEVEQRLLAQPSVDKALSILGFSFSGVGQNAASVFTMFKDWSLRGKGQSVQDEAARMNAASADVREGSWFTAVPPPIPGMGEASGFMVRLQDRNALGHEALAAAREKLMILAEASPVIDHLRLEALPDAPQLHLHIDRAQALALGVAFEDIVTTLSTAFGSATVNEFSNQGRMQRVLVQADVQTRMSQEDVLRLNVANRAGHMVPLASFASVSWRTGPAQVTRYNGYMAEKLGGDAAAGYSTGQAMAEMERLATQLPTGIGLEWTGLSLQEKLAGAQAPLLLGLALLVVFLILVALYESWAIPFSVILIVPLGMLGAVLAVMAAGMTNDVYFKVGLVTIIGLSAKNAILIIEFARELAGKGMALHEAALTAARLRFRPIVMTSLAFMLGVVPLIIASGAGAESQNAIGTGVFGGMLSATLLGVLFAPVFFVWVLGWFRKPQHAPADVELTTTKKATAVEQDTH